MSTIQVSRTTKIILIVEFILLAYMFYVLSTSLYKSYEVDRFIKEYEDQNTQLEETNNALAEDYEYYDSDAYKEKIAKQNFGLVRPGEEVIILVPDNIEKVPDDQRAAQISRQYYRGLSNPRRWFLFFFDRERFSR